jgi:AcrR family transcriptional regulator
MNAEKPLRADARRNRDAIVAAARAVFERGQFDLRFDDFAPLAGVGTGTLYRHFPTRESLILAVYQQEVADLCEHARRLRETRAGAEALALFLRDFVNFMQSRLGLARILTSMMAANSAEVSAGSTAIEQAVTELVAAGVGDGTLRADVGAGAVLVALHGVSSAHDRADWRAEADDLITLLIDGMRPPR